jgi:hypothetical protein
MKPLPTLGTMLVLLLLPACAGDWRTAADDGTPRLVPTPIGMGPRYHPAARGPIPRDRSQLPCLSRLAVRYGVHLELFANGRVILVPAGIGTAREHGPAGCSYPLRTHDPTGVISVAGSGRYTLGRFFALWRQPLARTRLLSFETSPRSPVRAYLDGVRWPGELGAIPLRRHAEIVLELGPAIPPHASYRFPPGL